MDFLQHNLATVCHNRSVPRQVNRIHERVLQIVYMDSNLSFEDLLKKSGSVSIHKRGLQQLAVEIYKAPSSKSPNI